MLRRVDAVGVSCAPQDPCRVPTNEIFQNGPPTTLDTTFGGRVTAESATLSNLIRGSHVRGSRNGITPALEQEFQVRNLAPELKCNDSTRSFGVLCRGSNPRPRATHLKDVAMRREFEVESAPTDMMESLSSQYRPLAAVVLAAGEGTRMRSATPKVLHPLCGRPMILHVLDRLAELAPRPHRRRRRARRRDGQSQTVQEQLATEIPLEFVEQAACTGTGDAVSVGLTGSSAFDLDTEDDVLVLHRRHAAAARRDPRGARRPSTASPTPPRPSSPPGSTTRPVTAASSATSTTGRPHRRAGRRQRRRARRQRGQLVDLLLPARPARARVAAPRARERARRVLPDRRHRRAARRRPPVVAAPADDPTETLGVNDRAAARRRRGGAARPHQPALDARGRHDDRPRAHLCRRDGRARARRATTARHAPRGPHRRRRRLGRSGPTRTSSTRSSARAHRSRNRSRRRSRSATAPRRPVRVAAARDPARGRRPRRHVRRD